MANLKSLNSDQPKVEIDGQREALFKTETQIGGAPVSGTNPIFVHSTGEVSTLNSSTTPLTANNTFTGTSEDILNESIIIVTVFSNVASATDGLKIEWSPDGTNWDGNDTYTIAANTQKTFSFQPVARYFRVKYTNGGTNQTTFRLQTILKATYIKPSSHRIGDVISAEDDAELVKSALTAQKPNGDFIPINATVSGNLQITEAENGLAIAAGEVSGKSFIHKFGEAPDFDITDGFVSIWDGANDGGTDAMTYTYSATADIDSLVSSSGSDTVDIEIQGLDSSYNVVTQTITLTGQTRAALSTSLIRVFRMKNVGATNLVGQVYCYVNSAITGGVPDDKTKVRAIINDGNNQTLMAIYTIPNGKTGYMRDWYASLSRKKDAVSTIRLFARPFGQVFQLKHTSDIRSDGSSYAKHEYIEPEVFSAKTDIEMRADTSADTNGVAAGFDLVLVDD